MKDIKVLFRNPKDMGEQCALPTPSADVLLRNIEFFITQWKDAAIDGWYKVVKNFDLL